MKHSCTLTLRTCAWSSVYYISVIPLCCFWKSYIRVSQFLMLLSVSSATKICSGSKVNTGHQPRSVYISTLNLTNTLSHFPCRLEHWCSAVQGVSRDRERHLPQWVLPEPGLGGQCSGQRWGKEVRGWPLCHQSKTTAGIRNHGSKGTCAGRQYLSLSLFLSLSNVHYYLQVIVPHQTESYSSQVRNKL